MDALIFDFDGVVVDSEPIHLMGFQAVLRTIGVPLTPEAYYARYLGYDDHDCFTAVLRDHGRSVEPQQLQQLIADKSRRVQQAFAQSIEPLPGAVELIHAAARADVPLAICSGALRDEILLAAATVGVRDAFAVVVAAEDVQAGKPDPEGYRRARQALVDRTGRPLDPARCVVIEDSPAGIQAGREAGMKVLAVTTSYPADALTAAHRIAASLADITLDDLRRLADG